MRRAEYLKFKEENSSHLKTRIVSVRSAKSNKPLGWIRWYAPWRQYVFYPATDTLFNSDCLKTIGDEINYMGELYRSKLRREADGIGKSK
jgi:hypothetical protein